MDKMALGPVAEHQREEFNRKCNDLKKMYEENLQIAQEADYKLQRYNEADEVRARDEQIARLRKNALLVFSDKEVLRNEAFRGTHYYTCHNAGNFVYTLIGAEGIGTVIKIKCPCCGQEEDITDAESW